METTGVSVSAQCSGNKNSNSIMLEVQYRQLVLCPHYYTVDSTDSVAGWSGPIYVMDL